MTSLFISDLHLSESRPDLSAAFSAYCQRARQNCQALYILGDLVDAWLGDDDDGAIAELLRRELLDLSNANVSVFVMCGNRDFLLGEQFAEQCRLELLQDPAVVDLNGKPALLMHGDSLCTTDTEYMAFREKIRNPAMQQELLDKPLEERRQLAASLRAQSKSANASKAEDIMDVTQSEVERVMREHRVELLIHGHTHRPAVHEFDLDGQPAKRIVLGDWDQYGWQLTAESNEPHAELQLQRFELDQA